MLAIYMNLIFIITASEVYLFSSASQRFPAKFSKNIIKFKFVYLWRIF